MQIDGYFIYKHDDKQYANGDNADIYTSVPRLPAHRRITGLTPLKAPTNLAAAGRDGRESLCQFLNGLS